MSTILLALCYSMAVQGGALSAVQGCTPAGRVPSIVHTYQWSCPLLCSHTRATARVVERHGHVTVSQDHSADSGTCGRSDLALARPRLQPAGDREYRSHGVSPWDGRGPRGSSRCGLLGGLPADRRCRSLVDLPQTVPGRVSQTNGRRCWPGQGFLCHDPGRDRVAGISLLPPLIARTHIAEKQPARVPFCRILTRGRPATCMGAGRSGLFLRLLSRRPWRASVQWVWRQGQGGVSDGRSPALRPRNVT